MRTIQFWLVLAGLSAVAALSIWTGSFDAQRGAQHVGRVMHAQ